VYGERCYDFGECQLVGVCVGVDVFIGFWFGLMVL